MATAWIGLGSNLNNPIEQVHNALQELQQLPASQLVQASRLWHSKPLGPQDQPDFINAVAQLDTQLEPLDLLDELQKLERQHHRQKTKHWGPRTLDLDILSYADLTLDTQRLTLPHPEIAKRAFVLLPWAELDANWFIPGLGKVKLLLQQLTAASVAEVLPLEANSAFKL